MKGFAKKTIGAILGTWAFLAFIALCWLSISKGPEMAQAPILFFVLGVFATAVRLLFGRRAMWITATWLSGGVAFFSGILFLLFKMSDMGAKMHPDGLPLEAVTTYVFLGAVVVVGGLFSLLASEKSREEDNYFRLFGRTAPTKAEESALLK